MFSSCRQRVDRPLARAATAAASLALALLLAGCGVFDSGKSGRDADSAANEVTPEGMVGTTQATPEVKAFEIEVRAPGEIRELLEKHLELNRYQAVTDLNESELARLLVLTERDARNLVATQGYFSPTIDIAKRGEVGNRPTIVVDVQPGEITKIGNVDIGFRGDIETTLSKDAIEQRQKIRNNWKLPKGQNFTQQAWAAAKQEALRGLVVRRYPAGKIADSEAAIDAPERSASLGLRLDSGPLYRYGQMKVSGIERYDPALVPRIARLDPGAVYDQEQVDNAQKRLAGSGYFDSAFIFIDPNEGEAQSVPVQVTVREAPRKKVVFGVGFTTDGGPHASVEYTDLRVPGIGWRATTKLQLETRAPYAQTEWSGIPNEDGWRWGVLARYDRLNDEELITTAQKLRIGRSQQGDQYDRGYYVQYDRASVRGSGASSLSEADAGNGSALSANYLWTGRYFDSLPYPTRGHGLGVEAGGGLTLDEPRRPFLRAVVRWLGIVPLSERQGRLQFRAEGGAVEAASDARIPGTQQFRTGGDTSVRGYAFRSIGIDRPNGVTAPGRFMAVSSVEWQRPYYSDGQPTAIENTFFVDVGDVADQPQDLRAQVGIGTGVRVRTPIGPLSAALAYGLDSRRFRLHLSVGFSF